MAKPETTPTRKGTGPRKSGKRGKGRRRKRKSEREQGVALLMVLAALAVMLPFTATFNYDAHVDWQSAVNSGDEVKARNLQRGALQLSVLMFELQRQVFNQKQFRELVGGQMDVTQVAPYLMSVFGSQDGVDMIGDFVGVETDAFDELAIEEGSFEARVEAESGKINVNCLGAPDNGKQKPRDRTIDLVSQLQAPTLYDSMFEEEKSDGQRYTREDLTTALTDYVDDDRTRYDVIRLRNSSAGEQGQYEQLYDPYQPRNARFDSIEELHLVRGIDDDWMAAFGNELTVYGACKVNLNFASPRQIAMVIRHAVSYRDTWKTEGENFLLMVVPLANFVVESRAFNLFEKLVDVKAVIIKPDQFVFPGFLGGDGEESASVQAGLPRIPDGIEVRVNEGCNRDHCWGGMREVATTEPERYYRLEIITTVGAARKRLSAVYDMQFARSHSEGKGAWLYYREE